MSSLSCSFPDNRKMIVNGSTRRLPVVFACAGCSSAGRAAYEVAQQISSRGEAEMSCLAGIAAELPYFEKQAAGRELWVVDGCPLRCVMHVLCKQGRTVGRHIRLYDYGIKKNEGFSAKLTAAELTDQILSDDREATDARSSRLCNRYD